MILHIEFDRKADAVYVYFSGEPVAYTKKLDDMRYVDYAADDAPTGIELLNVSDGVNIDDLPFSEEVERLLRNQGIKTLVQLKVMFMALVVKG